MDKLEIIFALQEKFGSKFTDFKMLSERRDAVTQEAILAFIDHTIEELIELRREMPFRKNWSTKAGNTVDWSKALDEYVDVLHFFVSIALIAGWSAEDVFNGYLAKNNINHDRQKEGY